MGFTRMRMYTSMYVYSVVMAMHACLSCLVGLLLLVKVRRSLPYIILHPNPWLNSNEDVIEVHFIPLFTGHAMVLRCLVGVDQCSQATCLMVVVLHGIWRASLYHLGNKWRMLGCRSFRCLLGRSYIPHVWWQLGNIDRFGGARAYDTKTGTPGIPSGFCDNQPQIQPTDYNMY
ncbi:hypothetical protein Tco_0092145 [Tanacetum coccineum]